MSPVVSLVDDRPAANSIYGKECYEVIILPALMQVNNEIISDE
jgi:hypothetical protein